MGMLLSKGMNGDSRPKPNTADANGENHDGLDMPGPKSEIPNASLRAHQAPSQVSRSTRGPGNNRNDASHEVDRMRFAIAFRTQISPYIESATERHAGTLSALDQHQIRTMVSSTSMVTYISLINEAESESGILNRQRLRSRPTTCANSIRRTIIGSIIMTRRG